MNKTDNLKKDNRGLTLVELLVTLAVSAVLAGAVSALIGYSVSTYNRENVNTEMQYELQSNINMMMDEIMGASVFVVKQNSGVDPDKEDEGEPYTKYALFGNPYTDIKLADGTVTKGFSGVIFVSASDDTDGNDDGRFRIYMNRIVKEEASRDAAMADLCAIAASDLANGGGYAEVSGNFSTDPNPYLLGENLTQFVIEPDPNGTSFSHRTDPDDSSKEIYEYTNPIEVKVEISFERDGWGTKKYNKHVEDITYLRNKVTDSVFVDDGSGTFTTYKLKGKED